MSSSAVATGAIVTKAHAHAEPVQETVEAVDEDPSVVGVGPKGADGEELNQFLREPNKPMTYIRALATIFATTM